MVAKSHRRLSSWIVIVSVIVVAVAIVIWLVTTDLFSSTATTPANVSINANAKAKTVAHLTDTDNGRSLSVDKGTLIVVRLNTYAWHFRVEGKSGVLRQSGNQQQIVNQKPTCGANGVCVSCPVDVECGYSTVSYRANEAGSSRIVATLTVCGDEECASRNDSWTVDITVR